MYVHSVRLENYKSIGDYPESEVILEPRVTAIIGKNESGKSNVITGLKNLNLWERNASAFLQENVNRNCPVGTENVYVLTLKSTKDEIQNGIETDTQILISKSQCLLSGGFLLFYQEKIFPIYEELVDALNEIGANPFQAKDQEWTNYRSCISELKNSEQLDLYQRMNSMSFLKSRILRITSDMRGHLQEVFDIAYKTWFELVEMFPVFFYRNADKHLKTMYKLEEVEKEVANISARASSLLYEFIDVIAIEPEVFISAVKTGTSAQQETLRKRICRLVDRKINKPFQEFYKTEEIELDLSFNNGTVSFMIRSNNGESLLLSERSNGLKWYLETFIEMQSHDIEGKNVVFLLDEPGTSLHVNAQRELIHLFHDLADKGNQVVYTTHSPYMLDLEKDGVHRIRAVVKDAEGFSRVYKTAYDARIIPECQKETLAPIISALGMNLNDTFGPAKDKFNIVTEGMSDYIFLCTMAKVLDVDTSKYAIIPSVGVTNCINICSILHAWGCRYIALFDYDKEGVEKGGEFLRNDMMFEYKRQYCYVKEVCQADIDRKTYKTDTFMIEDVITREEIDGYCEQMGTSKEIGKPLMAKLMCNAIEEGKYCVGERCKSNFIQLFERIFACFGE